MHAVLQNTYLLTIICEFVLDLGGLKAKAALLSLTLVCRDISCIALSILWRDIYLDALCFTFPKDIVFMGEDGRKSWNLTPITPEQWFRFDKYARYIREIAVDALHKDSEIDGLFDALGRYPHSQNRFPRLERLTLQCIEASRFRDAAILLCPTLTEVTISLEGMNKKGHRDVADFLQALGGKSTCLQHLHYYDDDETMTIPAIFDDTLSHLIRHSTRLQTVKIPLSRNTLGALAQLPSLTHLELYYFGSPLAGRTPVIGITQNKQPDERDTFVSLESLVISLDYPWPSMANFLKSLFKGFRCAPRTFETRTFPATSAQLEPIEFARFLEDMFSQRQNAQPQSVGLEDFTMGSHGSAVTVAWKSFNWLLSFPNLLHLRFHGLFFDISDLALEEITKMWRNLHSLHFTADPDEQVEGYQSQITFSGIAHLSRLPKLRNLSLMLNTSAQISSTMLSTKSLCTSALATLKIEGEFPKVAIIDATLFFAKHFPNLKEIIAGGSEKSRKQWGEVEAGLHAVQQTLASVRNGMTL